MPLNSENRKRVRAVPVGVTRTEQQHEGATKIKNIMARYRRTNMLPQRGDQGFYGDFTSATDFHDTLTRIKKAEEAFLTLPASIRKHFKNDPGELAEFMENPENRDKAMELGIIPRPPVQDSPPSEPVSEPPSEPVPESESPE